MTRLMLFLAHRMDYPPAGIRWRPYRRGQRRAAVSSSITTPASTISTVQASPDENVRWKPNIPTVLAGMGGRSRWCGAEILGACGGRLRACGSAPRLLV